MVVKMRRPIAFALLTFSLFVAAVGVGRPEQLQPVDLRDICVTNGEIRPGHDGRLQIDSPSSRAVLRFRSQPAVEIRFTYLGPSAQSKPLASGELRRQIGIKLRAENTCNLVYAMWHIEPDFARRSFDQAQSRYEHTRAMPRRRLHQSATIRAGDAAKNRRWATPCFARRNARRQSRCQRGPG